jgi:16S rRNA processing protein RimM
MAAQNSSPLILGRILAPHGVRGWLKVQSFADPPQRLLERPQWQLCLPSGERVRWRLRAGEWDGRWLRVAFEGVTDRDAAAALRGAQVEVERGDWPAPAAGEYYRDDLLGLEVRNASGELLGTVQYFIETPGNPVMVVRGAGEHWVPVTPRHLLKVRLPERQIDVDWPSEL